LCTLRFLEALNHGQLAIKSFGKISFVEEPIVDHGYQKSQFYYIIPADSNLLLLPTV
jgi:hypothetical protein